MSIPLPNAYIEFAHFVDAYGTTVKPLPERIKIFSSPVKSTLVIIDNILYWISIEGGYYVAIANDAKSINFKVTQFVISLYTKSVDRLEGVVTTDVSGKQVTVDIKDQLLNIYDSQGKKVNDYLLMIDPNNAKLFGDTTTWRDAITENGLAGKLDNSIDAIHFRNGKVLIGSCEFVPRVIDLNRQYGDFVTRFINRDFILSSDYEEEVRLIDEFFAEIIREPEARHYLGCLIGSALTGHYHGQVNHLLHLIGVGSNGKSTLVNMIKAMLDSEVYCLDLPNNFLSSATAVTEALKNATSNTRFLFIDEPKTTKCNDSILKNIVDGKWIHQNKTTLLKAKVIMTSNRLVSFNVSDGGLDRRIIVYLCKNKFLPAGSLINGINEFIQSTEKSPTNWSDYKKNACLLYFCRLAYKINITCIPQGVGLVVGLSNYFNIKKVLNLGCKSIANAVMPLDTFCRMLDRLMPCYFTKKEDGSIKDADKLRIANFLTNAYPTLIKYNASAKNITGILFAQDFYDYFNTPEACWCDLSHLKDVLIDEQKRDEVAAVAAVAAVANNINMDAVNNNDDDF